MSATCAFEGMLLHVLLLQQQCRGSGVYSLSFPRSLLARGGDEICSGNSSFPILDLPGICMGVTKFKTGSLLV